MGDMVMDTAMDTMVTMATTARDLLMPTTATEDMEDTEDMVMDTAMDMVDMVTMATTARDLLMPTTATEDMEDTEDMVMATVMDTVMAMATDTTDKKDGVVVMSRWSSVDTQ